MVTPAFKCAPGALRKKQEIYQADNIDPEHGLAACPERFAIISLQFSQPLKYDI
jgi:hypothetical protein